jgi:tetratricopeptide (TPR) repeat protein
MALALAAAPVPAWAGETVLYKPAPDWVQQASIEGLLGGTEDVVLMDRQRLLDRGTESIYEDVALRLKTPDTVTKFNTVTLQWYPDKGDLTVHKVQIIRDGKTIDVLGSGAKFTVLRRETGLEKREVNGVLTAAISIPDLRVGDILRFTKSTTMHDQAFPNDVQLADQLLTDQFPIGLGREIVSWPADQAMKWKVVGNASVEGPVTAGGFKRLSVKLPVAKQPEMPGDAPFRYRATPILQVTSFDSWRQVSASLAPFFKTDGTITPGGPLAVEVDRIKRSTTVPLERAALALQLVQDQISYLAKGMDGGNYIPQKPEETWSIRYGDCKAKSYLLAAMLNAMGIKAEPVIVLSSGGDLVSSLLPEAGDFDHMIVRASIGGQDYWLDGTSSGTRMSTIAEVPAFEYALPLAAGGADLVTIAQHWQPTPDRVLHLTYDHSAGFDLPTLYDADVELTGVMASRVREAATEKDPKKQREFVVKYMDDIFKGSSIIDGTVTYDEPAGKAHVHASGIFWDNWKIDNGKASIAPVMASTGFEFAPDRARAAWKDIPIQLGGPVRYREEVTILLPQGGEKATFSGLKSFAGVVAGRKIERSVSIKDRRIDIVDDIATIPVEITPDKFAEERAKAAALASGDPKIELPADAPYSWQLDDKTFLERTRKLDAGYGEIIAHDPDDASAWTQRATLRSYGPDKKGALADFDKAIELGANSDRYRSRALLKEDMGDFAGAADDAREAYELDPKTDNALFLANRLADGGQAGQALELLKGIDATGDDKIATLETRAQISGQAKRLDEGWQMLQEALAERPGSDEVLSAECWYVATWKYKLEQAPSLCTKAVEASQWSAETLDSRALAYYRLGRMDDALADLNAALRSDPSIASSRYMRGIIKSAGGADDARRDIEDAMRLSPSIAHRYQKYGVSDPK